MKATFEILDTRHLRDSERSPQGDARNRDRWSDVLEARASQGRFGWKMYRVEDKYPDRTFIEFEWPQEQHGWMRHFLARFWRAWCRDDMQRVAVSETHD